MHLAFLKFSVLRLTVFVVTLGVLLLIGLRGFLVFVLAAAISLVLSYILLARQRDELALALDQRVRERQTNRHQSGAEADAAAEDGTTTDG